MRRWRTRFLRAEELQPPHNRSSSKGHRSSQEPPQAAGRGLYHLNTGDKAVAGALIFVALVAISIQAIVYLLGP